MGRANSHESQKTDGGTQSMEVWVRMRLKQAKLKKGV